MRLILAAVAVLHIATVQAAEWQNYANARFGYSIDVPPGFSLVGPSDRGDGASFRSADGRSTLVIWGDPAPQGFQADFNAAANAERRDGWQVLQQTATPGWALLVSAKGPLMRDSAFAPACDGTAVAGFQFTYPTDERDMQLASMRLQGSLVAGKC
jgi:hypothetical protein